MADVKPFLLFAAWEDGTVVRRAEAGKAMGGTQSLFAWAASKLTIGSVRPAQILALQAAIAEAGFFRPPLADGMRSADGPSQGLCVRYGKARRLLSHHGPSDKGLREDIERMGPGSDPSRERAEAFVAMWDKIAKLLDTVVPEHTTEFHDERELTPPDPFDATDENGDPSIAYWGLPEYCERREHAGTPQAVVTMTVVQTTTAEKYLALKKAGKTEDEERHGDWVYFSTSDMVRISGDKVYNTYVGRTTRYKVRIPATATSGQATSSSAPSNEQDTSTKR